VCFCACVCVCAWSGGCQCVCCIRRVYVRVECQSGILFVAGCNGVCGLRETHAGLLQPVSDSWTVALFSFGCVL